MATTYTINVKFQGKTNPTKASTGKDKFKAKDSEEKSIIRAGTKAFVANQIVNMASNYVMNEINMIGERTGADIKEMQIQNVLGVVNEAASTLVGLGASFAVAGPIGALAYAAYKAVSTIQKFNNFNLQVKKNEENNLYAQKVYMLGMSNGGRKV